MVPPADDHDCGWKVRAADLEAKLEEVVAKMAAMERRLLGPKSEKLPPIDREVRKQRPTDPAATRVTRRKNAELRATRVVTEDVPHKVPAADRTCPKCDGTDLRPVGDGKISAVLDYVPGYFRRRQHIRETLACVCGEHIVTAPTTPSRVRATATASAPSSSPPSAPTLSPFTVRLNR